MPAFYFDNIRISCIASAVPLEKVFVDDFVTVFGEDVVRGFKLNTGVESFRRTSKFQTASDLGFVAAEKIIAEKHISKSDIGALVFVSHSVDYRRPATAAVLHKRLGLSKECAAFDVNLGCSAFVYGLQIVSSLMQCSDIRSALLITGETLTKLAYPRDKSVAMLFGDAGSAVLLEKQENADTIRGILRTDGQGYKAIIAPAGGFRNMEAPKEPIVWDDGNERTLYNTYMNGSDVFGFTISDVPTAIRDFLRMTNTSVDEYDSFAFHQASTFILKRLSKKLAIPYEKMAICINKYGNTSAPSIPLALCDAFGAPNMSKQMLVMMCGFGVGLSWGIASARINVADVLPVVETGDCFMEGIINSPNDL